MEVFLTRFQHIAKQTFEQLDEKSLSNCREVSKSWQKSIEDTKLAWIQIATIPENQTDGSSLSRLLDKSRLQSWEHFDHIGLPSQRILGSLRWSRRLCLLHCRLLLFQQQQRRGKGGLCHCVQPLQHHHLGEIHSGKQEGEPKADDRGVHGVVGLAHNHPRRAGHLVQCLRLLFAAFPLVRPPLLLQGEPRTLLFRGICDDCFWIDLHPLPLGFGETGQGPGKKRRQDGILLGIEEEGRLQEELYNHYVTKIEKIKKLVSGFVQSVLVFPVNFQLEVNS